MGKQFIALNAVFIFTTLVEMIAQEDRSHSLDQHQSEIISLYPKNGLDYGHNYDFILKWMT